MSKVKILTVIETEQGEVRNTINIDFNEMDSKEIVLEYVTAEDGGPLMRPKNPPRS